MSNRISTGFKNLTQIQLRTKTQVILAAMTNNPNFPAPVPSIATVINCFEDFETAFTAVNSGNKLLIAQKNQYKEQLITLLINLAGYVTFTAAGDLAVLDSSGFDLVKNPSTAILTKPENMVLKDGLNMGELFVSITRVRYAKTYLYQYSTLPDAVENNWVTESSTLRKHTFKQLESGKRYYVRVVAIGSKHKIVYSDVLTRISQ